MEETDIEKTEHVTACTKGAYTWVPANCQEVDDEWYFLIRWKDCKGGWKGKAQCGTILFCDFKNKVSVVSRPAEKTYGQKIKAELEHVPSLNAGFKPWGEKKRKKGAVG